MLNTSGMQGNIARWFLILIGCECYPLQFDDAQFTLHLHCVDLNSWKEKLLALIVLSVGLVSWDATRFLLGVDGWGEQSRSNSVSTDTVLADDEDETSRHASDKSVPVSSGVSVCALVGGAGVSRLVEPETIILLHSKSSCASILLPWVIPLTWL